MHRKQLTSNEWFLWFAFAVALNSMGIAELFAANERPNVLFIAVDDLNDWIGCLGGHPDAKTPHLDRLAERGMLFTNAHCAAPACRPSRCALMTGQRPSTTGVYTNQSQDRPTIERLQPMNKFFMQHGYDVVGAGKIYHSSRFFPGHWGESVSSFPSASAVPAKQDRINPVSNVTWGAVPNEFADSMGDTQTVSWIIEQLKADREKPLFLACGIFRPHMPWFAPESFFDQYPPSALTLPKLLEDDLQDIPAAGRKMAIGNKRAGVKAIANSEFGTIRGKGLWSNAVQAYLASMSYADQQVGRLLDALDESGQADNTIIVLWGDHGWHLGEKHHWKKFTLWEEATRVPLIIVAPGVTKANQQTDQPVSLLDIYPTLVNLCQLPEPNQLDGKNLRPLLDGSAIRWDHAAVTTHGKDNHAVRNQHWRYIRYQDGTEELYDHRADPQEWTNLADDVRFAQVKTELAAWLPQSNAEPTPQIRSNQKKSDSQVELGQFDWGSAEVAGQRLVLTVNKVNEKREITVPRLNNSLTRIHLNGKESKDVRMVPEPTEWRIGVPEEVELPCTVELEFGQAVYLPTSPRTITPDESGSLVLHARDAVTHGKLLRFEPQPHKNTIGYWANQDDWAEWHFRVTQPGTYQVTLRQGCGNGHGGSEVLLQIGQQELTFQVEETGGFQNWRDRQLGTVTLDAAESVTLQLRPQSKPGGAVMDVQQITLMPVADTDTEE